MERRRTVTDKAAPLLERHRSLGQISLVQCVTARHAIHQTLDAQRVGILQRFGEDFVRVILIAHRSQKAVDSQGAYRSATGIGSRRVRAAMNHGIAHFNTGRVTVEQHPASLHFQHRQQVTEGAQVVSLSDQGGGQLAVHALQRAGQLVAVSDFDNDGGRAEDFFLQ